MRIWLSQAPAEIYNLEMTHGVNLFLIQKHLSLWTILRWLTLSTALLKSIIIASLCWFRELANSFWGKIYLLGFPAMFDLKLCCFGSYFLCIEKCHLCAGISKVPVAEYWHVGTPTRNVSEAQLSTASPFHTTIMGLFAHVVIN